MVQSRNLPDEINTFLLFMLPLLTLTRKMRATIFIEATKADIHQYINQFKEGRTNLILPKVDLPE